VNAQALKTISKLRRVNQSGLAKMTGLSRQAVSNWFKTPPGIDVNTHTPILKHLAAGLHVKAEDLLQPLPVLDDPVSTRQLETALLWDALYSDLSDFSIALVRGEAAALARLVQIFGLYAASKIAGRKIWDRFPDFKRSIRPVRREQLERVWQFHQTLS
jgi:transcriptional regulator with XRE-family HTH domain